MSGGYGDIAALLTFVGGIIQGQAQREAAEQVKKWNEAKQVEAEQDAASTEQWARYNENQQRRADKLKRSRMSVRYIKSGVTTEQGTTAALVLEEQEIQDEMAALSIKAKGISDAARLRSRASFFNVAGRNAEKAGKTQSIGTMIGAAAQSLVIYGTVGSGASGSGASGSGGTT